VTANQTTPRGPVGTPNRLAAGVASVAAHTSILLLILASARPLAPMPAAVAPIVVPVELVSPPPPSIAQAPATPEAAPAASAAAAAQPTSTRIVARPRPAPANIAPLPASENAGSGTSAGVSDGDLAGAALAGSGRAAGACDMVGRLQAALRKDPLVRAAAAQAGASGNHAIRVWNGDWVQNGGEDGKGLSAVREAILWEVGFAPAACRAESVRGLVLISMNEAPGSARLVLGTSNWRWGDLLAMKR